MKETGRIKGEKAQADSHPTKGKKGSHSQPKTQRDAQSERQAKTGNQGKTAQRPGSRNR